MSEFAFKKEPEILPNVLTETYYMYLVFKTNWSIRILKLVIELDEKDQFVYIITFLASIK